LGLCSKCIHFRRLIPASQLLAQDIGTTDAAISNGLIKIQEDENQQKGTEAQMRTKKEIADDQTWDFRPVMSDYCGLQESEDTYLIAEIKNSGGRCSDFRAGVPEKHSCTTCIHRVPPQGFENDLETEKIYSGMSFARIAEKMSTSPSDDLLRSYRDGTASRKAFEIAGIYASKGTMGTIPQYFAYCRKFSEDYQYVICIMRNSHQTCSAWEPNNETK
jgi:hypothetical protein